MADLSMDFTTQLALTASVALDVAEGRSPVVQMRPGSYSHDPRRVSVEIDHIAVRVCLNGTPEALQAWAEELAAIAFELGDEADDVEDFLTGEVLGTEVAY